jgi:sugar phosphate isomerase/epimerase
MHPRLSLHQVAFLGEGEGRDTRSFLRHCADIGIGYATLVTPVLQTPEAVAQARAAITETGVQCATINHPFAQYPDIENDTGTAAAELMRAIGTAQELGASAIYLVTGARGTLGWEDAARRFSDLIGPCLPPARENGVSLLVETASPFNVDIHMAHTLDDTIRLAQVAHIGVCVELHACWYESGLDEKFRRAMPVTGLVQVSDYVAGDRTAPCRAVPGDGVIPLERLVGKLLDAGYKGLFDIELVGPRIEAEGPREATKRAAETMSELLVKLGA